MKAKTTTARPPAAETRLQKNFFVSATFVFPLVVFVFAIAVVKRSLLFSFDHCYYYYLVGVNVNCNFHDISGKTHLRRRKIFFWKPPNWPMLGWIDKQAKSKFDTVIPQQCKGKYQRAVLYVSGDALRVVDEVSKVSMT